MGGKRAHAVVDSQGAEVALDEFDADHASGLAMMGFLSAPSGDPVPGAFPGVGDMRAIKKAGGTSDAAFLALTGAFEVVLDPDTGRADFPSAGQPFDPAERPMDVTDALTASVLLPEMVIVPEAFTAQARQASVGWNASEVVTEIYTAHYSHLVRLAVMLVHDVQTAEEMVQDAFEAMHLAWLRLRDSDKALAYLRQSIVNKSRSELRHRRVVETHAPKPAPDEQSAEHAALTLIERSAVISALRMLPPRQREAIVLRYYGDFTEAEIAKAMGISKGAVKSHTARAMAALKLALEQGAK